MPHESFRMMTKREFLHWCIMELNVGAAEAEAMWVKMLDSEDYEKDNGGPNAALRIKIKYQVVNANEF